MKCTECGGAMWDNREKKASGAFKAKSPDYKCKNENCGHVVWPPKKDTGFIQDDKGNKRIDVEEPLYDHPDIPESSEEEDTKIERLKAIVEIAKTLTPEGQQAFMNPAIRYLERK